MSYLDDAIAQAREQQRMAAATKAESVREADYVGRSAPLDLASVLRDGPLPRVIPQIKRGARDQASADFHAGRLASAFVDAGAPCVSVDTSARAGGSLGDLSAVGSCLERPVLWSDIVVHRRQLLLARSMHAAAATLVVDALEAPLLRDMIVYAQKLGLVPVCRVHDSRSIERALAAGAGVIEASAREPATGAINLERACSWRKLVPPAVVFLVGGGVTAREQVQAMRTRGVDAVLVGRHLMQASDPGLALMDLAAP